MNALEIILATVEPGSPFNFAAKLRSAGLTEVRGAPYYRFLDPSRWLRVDLFDNGGPHVDLDLCLGGLDVLHVACARAGERVQMLQHESHSDVKSIHNVLEKIKHLVSALRDAETTDAVHEACRGLVAPGILSHVKAGRCTKYRP